ncbi:MAG: HPr(Ser) kinase/phosphatase [bacterium]
MSRQITVQDLFDSLRERLSLKLIAGKSGLQNIIFDEDNQQGDYIIAGPLNYIHPLPVQTIGPTEERYLGSLSGDEFESALDRLFAARPAAILLVNKVKANRSLIRRSTEAAIPLLSSPIRDNLVLDNLQYFGSKFLAQRATQHGVFLEVLGMGVLLTGSAAVGKSELALELITRGHRLIADDVPEFTRIAPDIISGSCPAILRDFLEVRGLGVLDIRLMFGDSAISHKKYLQLIVNLKRMRASEIEAMDRLSDSNITRNIMGVEITEVTVPVAPGRNLAILVETAVRNHMLKLKGYDATEKFIERQQKAIIEQNNV